MLATPLPSPIPLSHPSTTLAGSMGADSTNGLACHLGIIRPNGLLTLMNPERRERQSDRFACYHSSYLIRLHQINGASLNSMCVALALVTSLEVFASRNKRDPLALDSLCLAGST